MVDTLYEIKDDFRARQMYWKAIYYSRAGYTNANIVGFSADNVGHQWREDIIEFAGLKTKVRLRLHNYPDKLNDKGLPMHTLEIEFSGEEVESAKKRLEGLTGLRF